MAALICRAKAGLDFDTVQELQGEVVRLRWRNPHVALTLGVTDENGAVVFWEIEAQDINTMSRRGLSAERLNEGEIIRYSEDGTQMEYSSTVNDPSTFTEAVTGSWLMDWRPDLEMQNTIAFRQSDVSLNLDRRTQVVVAGAANPRPVCTSGLPR